jgi:Ca2+-transporting ATPase
MTVSLDTPQPAYRLTSDAVITTLNTNVSAGLSATEAQARLAQVGKNELPAEPTDPAWKKFLVQFRNPLTILLLIATLISFIAWLIERESLIPFETLTILAIVIFNAVLGYIQENRAEKAVEALKAMSAPTARVLRDSQQHTIPSSDLAPGDVLLIEEGDTIPADARVIESIAMRLSESALTGESTSVGKDSAPIEEEAGIGDQSNMVFSGTAVTSGRGRAIVVATGAQTEIGKIAGTLQKTVDDPTPLQKELDNVGNMLGRIVIAIAILMALAILLVSGINSFAALVDVLLLAVSLAVAAVPEGLTAITTIVLSLGMQRMARRNVIVRKLNAVETLGSTTVISSDKTGTLTKNEMTVRAVVTHAGRVNLTGIGYAPEGDVECEGKPLSADDPERAAARNILLIASLANNAALIHKDGRWAIQGDPTEAAMIVAARKLGVTEQELAEHFPRVGEAPFTSERKMMSTAHADPDREDRYIIASKGAPDILLVRCVGEATADAVVVLTPERRADIQASIDQLAREALRTIGVAYRAIQRDVLTGELDEEQEHDFVWLGVVGMIDPPRPEAKQAVQEAKIAGIRPIMITGDHPTTAVAIASELGIAENGARALTGAELQQTDDVALRAAVNNVSVYARVAPEHKLRIVRALKENGHIAAMTGDGVNDAPALKSADIGVAMGITGTDVSKGAADMILTDDNFASIVAAVEEGRSIFANIQKFLRYLLSSNVGEVMVMFFGVILGGVIGLTAGTPEGLIVPLLATQILWINLLTDAGPALALGLEPANHDVMKLPPRDPRSRVIDRQMWFTIFYVGIIMAAGTLLVMDWALPNGLISGGTGNLKYAQTMAFTTLVCFQLFNVFNSRSERDSAFKNLFSNKWIWVAVVVSALLQVGVVYTPLLQQAFGTVPLQPQDWLICIAVGSSVLWLRELAKLVMRLRK